MKTVLGGMAVSMALVSALGVGCGAPEQRCEGTDEVSLFCGFWAPEDLEVLPGGQRLLVSEYGGLAGKRPGTIKLLQLDSGETETLYPRSGEGETTELWGDPGCFEEIGAIFAPHGIHLGKGPGGRDRLLVVNHGKRESIEIFELIGAATASPALRWRGCVVAPDEIWLNDVAGLPDGEFVASHMVTRGTPLKDLGDREKDRAPTGYVLEWSAEGGWQKLAGSDGSFANGVQISSDGKTVFANYSLGNQVIAIDRATGKRRWVAEVETPDNSSWAPDGRLVVASIRGDLEAVVECTEREAPFCGIDYGVVAIDPRTGESQVLAEGGGAPFGFATVAVQVGPKLYLGSATGDRIGIVDVNP